MATLTLLGGGRGAQYGSNAYDPVRMPSTAEVAERTRYRGYNYLRPVSGYREAVAVQHCRTLQVTDDGSDRR